MLISFWSLDISTISPLIIRLNWVKIPCWNFISFPMIFKDQGNFQILPKDSILTFMPRKTAGLLSICGWQWQRLMVGELFLQESWHSPTNIKKAKLHFVMPNSKKIESLYILWLTLLSWGFTSVLLCIERKKRCKYIDFFHRVLV